MSTNVSKDAKGYRINIRLPNGRTTCIRGKRLGIGQNQAAFKSVEFHISNLIGALAAGTAIPAETQAWIRRIGNSLRKKLEGLGLIQPRTDDQPLIGYLRYFFTLHGQGKKAGSRKVWARAQAHAEAYFKGGVTLQQVDVSVAKGFRNWLQSQPGRKPGTTMATATVNKTCGLIGQALSHAVESGLISSNPFASRSIPKTAGSNPDREQYVDRQTILGVISSCDDSEDRIVLALARFGCLRVPSEVRELRWSDIDWEKREMLVHSPKTAHLGKACRKVPLFPDLYDLLRNEYESGTSSEFLLPKLRLHPSLSMRVHRAAIKAGVAPWEKALQNLRASGVEDWLRAGRLPQDVARWCGHTPKVMYQHYMRIKDADSASNAALQAASIGGSGSGSDQAPEVVSAVVTSRVATSRQEKSPATQAAGDLDLMEFADDSCELVTVGGDCGDHLSMDLIGPQPDFKKPVNAVDSGDSDAGVVSIRPVGSVADAQGSDLAPLLRLLDAATPETRALLIRMLGTMLQHFHAQVSPADPLQPQARPEA